MGARTADRWATAGPLGHWNGRLRKWEYRARDERDLTDRVPNVPAAVMIYSAEGLARVFVADVDVVGAAGALLTHEVVALLERCGGRVVVDRSPAGKHHVYLPLRDGITVARLTRTCTPTRGGNALKRS